MATFLQHNTRKSDTALAALMQTALERKADIVLVQEPPEFRGNRHPAFRYLWRDRVLTAVRIDSNWTVSTEERFTKEASDTQVLALGRRGHSQRELRVVNTYHQGTARGDNTRGAERAEWDDLLLEDCILAGDFNAHSPTWNRECNQRRNARFLEELIETHDLEVKNNSQATRPESGIHSIIDLTLTTPGASPFCQNWRVLDDDGQATGSDHVVLEWMWTKPGPTGEQGRRFTGWALKGRLEREKEENWPPEEPKLADLWALKMGDRPILGQEATVEDLEDEIEYVQDTMRLLLDANVKRITICARSK